VTLAPEVRVVLTEALRPPAGFRVEVAVGTTYSLDLTSLLAVPLAFAVADELESGEPQDPVRLLDAVRRHADHTTVFCQAGGIHVPAYRRIMTFIEDGVAEVAAPSEGGIFHPKIWVLRFRAPSGEQRHRVVVLSRNLTFDRSWDTALVLDESPDGTIAAAPAAEFVQALPRLSLRPLSEERTRQVGDLAATLAKVMLAAPAPFTSGELVPIGTSGGPTWPFPATARRLLAISPFLTRGAVRDLAAIAPERTLVSRADSLDALGPDTVEGWSTYVLEPLAETTEPGGDDTLESEASADDPADDGDHKALGRDGFLERSTGLHAKTFVIDEAGGQSVTITGSANLTGAAWRSNVEFDAVLRGPTRACGVAATLDGPAQAPGLLQVLAPYTVLADAEAPDDDYATGRRLELFHHALAASAPALEITVVGDDQVSATLTLAVPDDVPGPTRVRLLSLPGASQSRDLAETVQWTLAPENVTPFVVVETTSGTVTRRCVLNAELRGAVGDRRKDALLSALASRRDVLRYIVFLLGDPSYDALLTEMAGTDGNGTAGWGSAAATPSIALFEPLVRAAGRDPEALARVAGLVADLRSLPNAEELVPEGFDAMWDAVWQAHEELQS